MVKFPDIETSFSIQLITSFMMLTIVVMSQFVTYPIYNILESDQLRPYQLQYLVKAFLIISPIMLLEMVTAIHLTRSVHNHDLHRALRTNTTIIGIIWGITFMFELPVHYLLLTSGYTDLTYRTLLFGNFIRVILWAIKCRSLTKIIPHMYKGEDVFNQEFLE